MAHTHDTEADTSKIGSLQLSPTYWNFVLEIKPQLGILIPLYRTQDFTTLDGLAIFLTALPLSEQSWSEHLIARYITQPSPLGRERLSLAAEPC